MALNSFADVQKLIQDFIVANNITVGLPHYAFWNTTYKEFVTGNVPGVTDPQVPILTKGDGAHSNIIYALTGKANTPWDPNDPNGYGRMPAGGPYFSDAQIGELSDWITAGCPEF
jgi:hypothetical protein